MNNYNQAPTPCQACGSYYTLPARKITTAGWVVFVVLLLLFFPLCWIGLLMKESVAKCANCGVKR